MATDLTTTTRTRRGLLAAALGATAAAVAASVARISPAAAADGDPVTVGGEHEGDSVTSFETVSSAALSGKSTDSRGVYGESETGQGVHGTSEESAGVAGVSTAGNGVHGTSTTNRGVWGESSSGPGVEGFGAVGVKAESPEGFALHTVTGRVRFDGISGIVTIPAGETEVAIETGVPVQGNTMVMLTPHANIGSRALWYALPKESGEAVVRISAPRNKSTKIAYLMIERA